MPARTTLVLKALQTIAILRKGTRAMDSMYPNQNLAAMAPSSIEGEPQKHTQPANFLYQAATVLAILLFLISF
jgi:L-asparaginase II